MNANDIAFGTCPVCERTNVLLRSDGSRAQHHDRDGYRCPDDDPWTGGDGVIGDDDKPRGVDHVTDAELGRLEQLRHRYHSESCERCHGRGSDDTCPLTEWVPCDVTFDEAADLALCLAAELRRYRAPVEVEAEVEQAAKALWDEVGRLTTNRPPWSWLSPEEREQICKVLRCHVDESARVARENAALRAEIERLKVARAEVKRLKQREEDIITACEKVADGGQYREDIVSAVNRIRRERDELQSRARAVVVDAEKSHNGPSTSLVRTDLIEALAGLIEV